MAKNWRGFLGIEGFSLRGDSVRGSDDSNQPRGRHLRRRNRRSSRSSSIPDENILAPDDSTYSNDSRRGASEERHHNGSGARLHPLIPSHGELSRVEEPSSAIVRRPVATSISRGNETSDPRSDQWEVQQKLVSASDHEQTYQREVQRYVDAVGSFNALRRFIEFHKIKIAKLSSIIERTPKAEHDECIKAALDKGDLETALHRFIEELMGNYNSTEIRVAAIQKAVRDLAQGLPIAVASQNRQQMRSAELHSLPTQVRDDIEKLIIQRQLYDSMNAKIRSNALELADPSVAKEQQRDGIEDLLDSFIAETRRMRADFQAQSNLNGRLQTDLSSLQLELMDYRDALMKANHGLAQANHDLMQANHDLKVQDEKWQAHWERETGKHKADLNREMSKHKADLDNARRVYEEKMRKRQSEHASEVAREKERLEKLHVQLEEQMSHHQQQLSERQREHHQAVEKERRAATEKEDKLKRDNEAFRSVLVARQHMKGLSDPEIATRFKRLLNLIDQFSRISWEKKKENQWPVTDSALRRTENARKMKKQIVQCCIWTMLNEKIFESPFKVFREEGAALHEDWAGHDSQDFYDWPEATDATEELRSQEVRNCLEALRKPESDRHELLKQAYEQSLIEATEAIFVNIGTVADPSDDDLRDVREIVQVAADFWLEVAAHKCRVQLIFASGSINPLAGVKLPNNTQIIIRPEIRRKGTSKGERLDREQVVRDCEGVYVTYRTH